MLANLPLELRALRQWVVAQPSTSKAPINAQTGNVASPTNPDTWSSFDTCEFVVREFPDMAVGFVLSKDDPFTIIDLDNPFRRKDKTTIAEGDSDYPVACQRAERHQSIAEALPSYTELSISGSGLHIIVRGVIPRGVRRDGVEVYCAERYMICTGNVVKQLPITEQQDVLDKLYAEMSRHDELTELVELEATYTDEQVLRLAAQGTPKFNTLYSGDFSAYDSQSDADHALARLLCMYSASNEQVIRLFLSSGLGQRDKAQRKDYLPRMLQKLRASEVPVADFSAALTTTVVPQEEAEAAPSSDDDLNCADFELVPPGGVGALAEFVYSTSARPVREVALMAALAYTAGICGRAYNIGGVGLNLYLVLLARTGSGKEAPSSALDTLLHNLSDEDKHTLRSFLGPSEFASGQGLVRVLSERPCILSILGEFGLTLGNWLAAKAAPSTVYLRKAILDLYMKSGMTASLGTTAHSDSTKDTAVIRAPSFTCLGETVPDTFYQVLSSSDFAGGFIPRFSILEYTGKRPPLNHNRGCAPSREALSFVHEALGAARHNLASHVAKEVALDKSAAELLNDFDKFADEKVNSGLSDLVHQLWTRAHIKALKIASVLAVGCSTEQPTVTLELATWATRFVTRDITTVLKRDKAGELGSGEHSYEAEIRKAVRRYLDMTPKQRQSYQVPKCLLDKPHLIPYCYFARSLKGLRLFSSSPRGATAALQTALQEAVKTDVLTQIPAKQLNQALSLDSPVYMSGSSW